jgi:hypothetical protein
MQHFRGLQNVENISVNSRLLVVKGILLLLLLLPLALQPAVGFGLSNNIPPFSYVKGIAAYFLKAQIYTHRIGFRIDVFRNE